MTHIKAVEAAVKAARAHKEHTSKRRWSGLMEARESLGTTAKTMRVVEVAVGHFAHQEPQGIVTTVEDGEAQQATAVRRASLQLTESAVEEAAGVVAPTPTSATTRRRLAPEATAAAALS